MTVVDVVYQLKKDMVGTRFQPRNCHYTGCVFSKLFNDDVNKDTRINLNLESNREIISIFRYFKFEEIKCL